MTSPYIGLLWNDLRLAGEVRPAGVNDPTLAVFRNGVRAYRFDNGVTPKEVFVSAQLPHSYKEGSDLKLHIHWGHIEGVNNGAVVWQAEYTWANNNEALPATSTTASAAANVLAADQYKPLPLPIVTINGAGKKVSSILLIRLFRDPTNAGDTSTANVYMLELDIHYQQDSTGTVDEMTKP